MTSFAERHHDETHAVLFDAWCELQNARVQERIGVWLIWLELKLFSYGGTTEESREHMARSLLWAIYEKNPRDFLAMVENRELQTVKG